MESRLGKAILTVEVGNESGQNEDSRIRILKQGLDLGGTSKERDFHLSLPYTDNCQISILIDKRDAETQKEQDGGA